jgi:2-oxoglutarate ferredoxin oxidoreductase subunit gamma
MSRKEILVTGAGGQGVLLLGNLLCLAAAKKGGRVIAKPTYGAAMRGGEVKCEIVISGTEIHDPALDDPDVVVALNDAGLRKFGSRVRNGGVLICEGSGKGEGPPAGLGGQVNVIAVPYKALGPEKSCNMVALGVYSAVDPDFGLELLKETVAKEMKKGGKESLLEENLKALQAGSDWYLRERGR